MRIYSNCRLNAVLFAHSFLLCSIPFCFLKKTRFDHSDFTGWNSTFKGRIYPILGIFKAAFTLAKALSEIAVVINNLEFPLKSKPKPNNYKKKFFLYEIVLKSLLTEKSLFWSMFQLIQCFFVEKCSICI